MEKATVVAWAVKMMMSWIPISSHNVDPALTQARYEQLASDYYDVATSEKPLFKNDDDHLKTIAYMAAVEGFESNYKQNAVGKTGDFCEMQIVPGRGIVFKDDVWDHAKPDDEDVITGKRLLEDHLTCARMGLHMMRASLRHTGDLGEYTGEGRGGKKAKHRKLRAEWAYARRPKDES